MDFNNDVNLFEFEPKFKKIYARSTKHYKPNISQQLTFPNKHTFCDISL